MQGLSLVGGRCLLSQQHVAVLGSGISGLSTAFFLRQKFGKDLKISIIESSNRVGGWIDTEKVEDRDGKIVLLERGPRSLRVAGNGRETLSLVSELKLVDELVEPNRESLQNRLLLDHEQLHPLPTSLFGALSQGLVRKAIPSFVSEFFKRKKHFVSGDDDESVYDFFERRFGTYVARTFASPLCLGIFSSNSSVLSINSCFPQIKDLEREYGSVTRGVLLSSLKGNNSSKKKEEEIEKKIENIPPLPTGVFSFTGGLSTLVEKLSSFLQNDENTEFLLSSQVKEMDISSESSPTLLLSDFPERLKVDHVFSTIPAHSLSPLIGSNDEQLKRQLEQIQYTSTAVINLIYEDKKQKASKYKAFGYLCVPSKREHILGVCFDSATFPSFTTTKSSSLQENQQESPLTRLTVMIGGDPTLPNHVNIFEKTEDELLFLSKSHLEKQLGLDEEPEITRVKKCERALPIYHVGYQKLLQDIHTSLSQRGNLSLSILGTHVGGAGVNDCVASARRTVDEFSSRIKGGDLSS